MTWNYTKTVALLLAGGILVRLAMQAGSGANLYGGQGAIVPLAIGATLLILPVAVIADIIAARRNRDRDYPE